LSGKLSRPEQLYLDRPKLANGFHPNMPPPASLERYEKRREKNKIIEQKGKSCIDRHNNYDVRWTQSPVIQTGIKE
jgi:hypothetical protein